MTGFQRNSVWLLLMFAGATGCVGPAHRGVPVQQLQPHWLATPKACYRPIDFTLLRKEPIVEHRAGPGDTLGVYVEGVISGEKLSSGGSEMPQTEYYFQEEPAEVPAAVSTWPAIGQPFLVQATGAMDLPLIGEVEVSGLSLSQVAKRVQAAYIDAGLLQADPSKSFVQISLIRPRLHRVLVIREDNRAIAPSLVQRSQYLMANRGDAALVQLVDHEADLLHALVATGGLPGEDAHNEVWILRGGAWDEAAQQFDQGLSPRDIRCGRGHTVIPLRYPCGAPLPFGPDDVVLQEGDVVFVEKRIEKHFYTGGLLDPGQIPLPRDEDIDVLEAIALANIGALGLSGQIAPGQQGQFSSGPGNVCPPTRVQVIRKIAPGQQVVIEVDLRETLVNAEERILIQPEDFIMLHYRPREFLINVALNFVDVFFEIPN